MFTASLVSFHKFLAFIVTIYVVLSGTIFLQVGYLCLDPSNLGHTIYRAAKYDRPISTQGNLGTSANTA